MPENTINVLGTDVTVESSVRKLRGISERNMVTVEFGAGGMSDEDLRTLQERLIDMLPATIGTVEEPEASDKRLKKLHLTGANGRRFSDPERDSLAQLMRDVLFEVQDRNSLVEEDRNDPIRDREKEKWDAAASRADAFELKHHAAALAVNNYNAEVEYWQRIQGRLRAPEELLPSPPERYQEWERDGAVAKYILDKILGVTLVGNPGAGEIALRTLDGELVEGAAHLLVSIGIPPVKKPNSDWDENGMIVRADAVLKALGTPEKLAEATRKINALADTAIERDRLEVEKAFIAESGALRDFAQHFGVHLQAGKRQMGYGPSSWKHGGSAQR